MELHHLLERALLTWGVVFCEQNLCLGMQSQNQNLGSEESTLEGWVGGGIQTHAEFCVAILPVGQDLMAFCGN